MPHTLLTISMITREALAVLSNALNAAGLVNREYDKYYGVTGAKIGSVVNVRRPVNFTVRTGRTVSLQDITETSIPVVLDKQIGVDFSFNMADLALSIDDFSRRYIVPAVNVLANKIDESVLGLYTEVPNAVGTPGTTPNTLSTFLEAGMRLDLEACPRDQRRYVVIDPKAQASMVDALKGLFHAGQEIADQYRTGIIGQAVGFKWYMDQNINVHTVGAYSGTPLVNGAGQTGSSLVTDGWGGGSQLKKGDIITVAGVYGVNPISKNSTGLLRQFVVTANATADGSGNMTIPIYPPIVTTGAGKTVTNSPADNAAITVYGSSGAVSPQSLAFHRDAFVLVTADLPLPGGVDMAAVEHDEKTGLSIRVVKAYNVTSDEQICRLDILYGVAALRPEHAVRIYG